MPYDFQQYQIHTEPVVATANPNQFESDWHFPWSEPVRFKVLPRLSIALIASGLFAPVLNPDTQINPFFESKWHEPWSEPKRFPKILLPGLNLFNSLPFPVVPNPSNQLQGWYQEFRGPVWPKKGLAPRFQQFLAYHPRYLPPANVTARMSATEVNADTIEAGVFVQDLPPAVDLTAVQVSISEIPAQAGGNISITEVE